MTTGGSEGVGLLASRETTSFRTIFDLALLFEDILEYDGIVRINPFCDQAKIQVDIFDRLVFLDQSSDYGGFVGGHCQP